MVDYDVYSVTIGFPLFFVCCYSTLPAIVSIPVKSSRTSGDPDLAWAGNMLSWGKCGLRLGRLEPPMSLPVSGPSGFSVYKFCLGFNELLMYQAN